MIANYFGYIVFGLAIMSVVGVFYYIMHSFHKLGQVEEQATNLEALNDQSKELLDYVKKQKEFESKLRSDPAFAKRVQSIINDNAK